jgi:hypothetical protein
MSDNLSEDGGVRASDPPGVWHGKRLWITFGAVAALVLLVVVVLIFSAGQGNAPRANRPVVAYMSSIALANGEGDIADVVGGASIADPLYTRLALNYEMQPIDDLRRLDAMAPDVLLLIQPRAFGPQENVAVDSWVRGGGRMVLLTDPMLHRESRFPKGDTRAPIYVGLASPLLNHWGLELTLPLDEAEPMVSRTVADFALDTATPGAFVYKGATAEATAPCRIKADGFIAQCDFGAGQAVIIADADFIDPRFWDAGGLMSNDDGVAMLESQLAAMAAP